LPPWEDVAATNFGLLDLPLERIETMRNKLPLIVAIFLAADNTLHRSDGRGSKTKSQRPAESNSDQKLIANSRAVWEAYKSRNIAAIKELTAEDYVSQTQAGPSNLNRISILSQKLTIESYTLDDPKVTWATKDVAILRYNATLRVV